MLKITGPALEPWSISLAIRQGLCIYMYTDVIYLYNDRQHIQINREYISEWDTHINGGKCGKEVVQIHFGNFLYKKEKCKFMELLFELLVSSSKRFTMHY